jgi:hypothetical protein
MPSPSRSDVLYLPDHRSVVPCLFFFVGCSGPKAPFVSLRCAVSCVAVLISRFESSHSRNSSSVGYHRQKLYRVTIQRHPNYFSQKKYHLVLSLFIRAQAQCHVQRNAISLPTYNNQHRPCGVHREEGLIAPDRLHAFLGNNQLSGKVIPLK